MNSKFSVFCFSLFGKIESYFMSSTNDEKRGIYSVAHDVVFGCVFVYLCMCVCVCVFMCENEGERERESISVHIHFTTQMLEA